MPKQTAHFPGMSFRSLCRGAGWPGSPATCGPRAPVGRHSSMLLSSRLSPTERDVTLPRGFRARLMGTRVGQALHDRGQGLPTLTGPQGECLQEPGSAHRPCYCGRQWGAVGTVGLGEWPPLSAGLPGSKFLREVGNPGPPMTSPNLGIWVTNSSLKQ